MVDVGDDVFSTLQYLRWIEKDADPQTERDQLSRALSDWAKLRNPFLV